MSFIDLLILAVFAASIIYGFKTGLVRQLGSIAAVVLAVIASRILGGAVGSVYGAVLPEQWATTAAGEYALSIAGRVTVMAIVYTVVLVAAKTLKTAVHTLLMGPLDRALGAVFAMCQWMIGLSLALNLLAAATGPDAEWIATSRLGGGAALDAIMSLVPALTGALSLPGGEMTATP